LASIDIYESIEEIMEQGGSMVDFYRTEPVLAAYDLLRVDLAPVQRIILRDMWFKNYCITVAGRGCGKSNDINSLSYIDDKGLCYLHEEFPPIPSFLNDGETIEIDDNKSIYTTYGFHPTKKISLEKNLKGLELKTKKGFVHRGSLHHPLLTIDKEGNFIYKQAQHFESGDRICIKRNHQIFGKNSVNSEDAYLMGLFLGDGMISSEYNHQDITTSDDEIKNYCINYCKNYSVPYRVDEDKRTSLTVSVIFKQFSMFFDKYGIKRCLSYDKEIPKIIRHSDKQTQIDFLQGLFDADGGFESSSGKISFCSVSKRLAIEVQMILLNFGIVSRLREKKTKSDFGKAFIVEFGSNDLIIFRNEINFKLKHKRESLDKYLFHTKLNTNIDTIPYVKDLCYKISKQYRIDNASSYNSRYLPSLKVFMHNSKEYTYKRLVNFVSKSLKLVSEGYKFSDESLSDLERLYNIIVSNYFFDVVESTSDWSGDCYDFEMDMEGEPNYFANGFINHNTFLLGINAVLHALLYPGYRVGLIAPSFRQSVVISNNYTTFWSDTGLYSNTNDFYDSVIEGKTHVQSLKYQNKILSKWKNDDRECIGIKTTKGFELEGTADHAIMRLNMDDANIEFCDLRDLNIDDYVLLKAGFNYFGNNDVLPEFNFEHDWRTKDCGIPTELTQELSYLFGLIVGDGCVSVDKTGRKNRVLFTSGDEELIDIFKKLMLKYFDIEPTEENNKDRVQQITYYCKKLVHFLLACGFTKTTALDKKIPDVVKKSSKECFISFVRGLMDTDGSCYVQTHKRGTHCEVKLSTSSLCLAKELQAFLLNIGIISLLAVGSKAGKKKLLNRNKYSVCSIGYSVRIIGRRNLQKAAYEGLFDIYRKKDKLNNYVNRHFNREESVGFYLGLPQKIVNENINKFKQYMDDELFFVQIKEIDHFFASTMDIEVENEHCYWAGGFINHNSKMIFSEVEKLYQRSSILREATEKKPTRGADTCFLKFRGTENSNGSYIEALPIGVDGAKIRGSRFYLIEIDELAQMPSDVIDMVIRPMAAVHLEPMQKVREIERIEKLIADGLATEDDLETDTANKMIMTSSGYFKFNHMWHRMKSYWKAMSEDGESTEYAVHQVPYRMMPKGFLDMKNINEAKRTMSSIEFIMEYEAAMVSDSEGFFKASLLESCTRDSDFTVKTRGESGKEYVLGIDPNQGGSALFGLVVVELGSPNKIVYVKGLRKQATQEMTKAIQRLLSSFNIVRIYMDAQGGGNAIKDLLAEGYNNSTPILDMDDDLTKYKHGRRILKMINFSPAWISDANFDTLSLLENNRLRFPDIPRSSAEAEEKLYDEIRLLKSQMLSIVVTETARGVRHFDTPKKGQNKDLYSAMILAAYGVRELMKDSEFVEPKLESEGLIRPHKQGSSFVRRKTGAGQEYMNAAVLQRKL